MQRALIGHTGFVGSNLLTAAEWTDLFNSRNFEGLRGRRFDEVVCCGVNAVKWQANADPDRDWAGIAPLLEVLDTVECGHMTLVSTIDVYPAPAAQCDEADSPDGATNHAYGRHRLAVEQRVAARFPNHTIVRLPALFGPGLKKNIIFDLMHNRLLDAINPASAFQWYPLNRLFEDIQRARALGLSLVNLVTEPVLTQNILDRLFPGAAVGLRRDPPPRYDSRTRYGREFGGIDGYVMPRPAVLQALEAFISQERER